MEIAISKALQSISNPFLNAIMLFLTEFGDELFFIAVAVILYWCINKRYAFQFLTVYFAGQVCVEVLKLTLARPRPFTYDGIVSIGEKTHGFSFPSGHSNSIANISTQLSIKTKKPSVIISGIFLTLVVMFTRIYLGQHFLTDTLVGCAIGVVVAFLATFLFKFVKNNEEVIGYALAPVAIILTTVFAFTGIANKGMMIMLSVVSAFSIGYAVEKRFVKYDVKSDRWWKYVVKVIIGIAVIFAIKEGFKALIPLDFIADGYGKYLLEMLVKEFLRYFLLTFTATLAMPALFKACKL